MVQPLWKIVWQFLAKLNILCEPTIMLTGIYPKELKTYLHIETCTQKFLAALFVIAKTRKQDVLQWVN